MIRKFITAANALWSDTSGIILPYVTLLLVAIVGMAVLALDGARYMSLQTQLQNGADALALAGAAELDRLPDSETRAVNAVNNLLANRPLFGARAGANVRVSRIELYSQLPASDTSPMSAGVAAIDPMNARFISVAVEPVTLTTVLPAALFGGANRLTTGASAVAGFDQVVCEVAPLFVCNPFETDGMTYDQASASLQRAVVDPAARRRMIQLRQNGGAVRPYAPGDYGFLDAPTLPGSSDSVVDAVAQVRPAACFRRSAVNIRPGAIGAVRDAFNVRFDLYAGAMLENRSNANYAPAENVRKGYVGGGSGPNACGARPATNWPIGSPPAQATGLPLDRTWPLMGGRMGDGDWDFETYWQVNHGGAGREVPVLAEGPAGNSNRPSRYTVYRYEIERGYVGDRSFGGETGTPACYAGAEAPAAPDRRIIHAAVLNCLSLGVGEAAQTNIPVAAFTKFFMTLPMAPSQTDLYVETIGFVTPGDGTRDFEMVQLHR